MKVTWTVNAKRSYDRELRFILKKWSPTEVADFMLLVDGFVEKLRSDPIDGKVYPNHNVQSFVISKQTTVFSRNTRIREKSSYYCFGTIPRIQTN